MTSELSASDPVAQLAEEFVARYRRGERPPLSEYIARCPEQGERIQELFPMLVMMEQAGPGATADELSTDTDASPEIPEQIGGHRLAGTIGVGGMGVVYEAEHPSLGRRALKVMRAEYASDPRGRERFLREVRAAARLHHSNIVTVYEVGEDGGRLFYTMQFIQGQPLDRVLDELRACRALSGGNPKPQAAPHSQIVQSMLTGPVVLSPAEPASPPSVSLPGQTTPPSESSPWHYYRSVARLGVQVAEALDYAHREGIVHRDIKPSNLLLDTEARVWVTDFGLAKAEGEDITHTGDVVGTFRYLAPERFRGWSDPRSDIYSLGLTLYEMLLLRPAFPEPDRVKLMAQIINEAPPRLRTCRPDIPRDLATIIEVASAREPTQRYRTAGEMASDLMRFLEDRPLPRRRPGIIEQGWRWCRRNPAVASLAGSLLAVLVVGLLAVTMLWLRALENLADARLREAEGLVARRPSGFGGRVEEILREVLSLPGARRDLDRLRTLAVAPLGDLAAQEPGILEDFPEPVQSVAVNGTGSLLAVGLADGSVQVYQTATRERLALLAPPESLVVNPQWPTLHPAVQTAFWSNNKQTHLVVVYQNGEVWLWDQPQRGESKPRPIGPVGGGNPKLREARLVRVVSLAPDGRLAVYSRVWDDEQNATRDREVCVYDLTRGEGRPLVKVDLGPDRPVWDLALHPTQQQLVVGRQDGLEWVDLLAEPPSVTLLPNPRRDVVRSVRYSSDGQFLGLSVINKVQVRKASPPFELVSQQSGDVIHPVLFRPQSNMLAFTSQQQNQIHLWDVYQARESGTLRHPGKPQRLAFSGDGNLLVSANATSVRIWRLAPLPGWQAFGSHDRGATGVAYTSDGEWTATVGHDDTIGLYNRKMSTRTALFDAPDQCVAFSPDGQWLAGAREPLAFWKRNDTTWKRGADIDLSFLPQKDPRKTILAVAFHPRGNYFAAGGVRGLALWKTTGEGAKGESPLLGEPSLLTTKWVSALVFSPNGRWLVYTVRGEGTIQVHDLGRSRKEQERDDFIPSSFYGNGVGGLTMTPDSHLVFLNQEREVEVWDLEKRKRIRSFPTTRSQRELDEASTTEAHVSMHPRQPWLAMNDPSALQLELWDIEKGQCLLRWPRRQGAIWWVAWDAEGEELALTRADGRAEAWRISAVRRQLGRFGLDW